MRKGIAGRSWLYAVVLVAVTAVWGWTFVVVQDAIALYGVIPFLAGRFILAGAALTPSTPGDSRGEPFSWAAA